jgi:hypothetical protein
MNDRDRYEALASRCESAADRMTPDEQQFVERIVEALEDGEGLTTRDAEKILAIARQYGIEEGD